jgi:hypothetical protein
MHADVVDVGGGDSCDLQHNQRRARVMTIPNVSNCCRMIVCLLLPTLLLPKARAIIQEEEAKQSASRFQVLRRTGVALELLLLAYCGFRSWRYLRALPLMAPRTTQQA